MEKKQKAAKKAPAVKVEKKVDKKKEITDKDLDKVSGGTQAMRDRVGHH